MNERTMAGHVLLTVAQSRRAYVGNLIVQKRLAEWIEEADERKREREEEGKGRRGKKRGGCGVISRRERMSLVPPWSVPAHRCTLGKRVTRYRAIFRPRVKIRHYDPEGRS